MDVPGEAGAGRAVGEMATVLWEGEKAADRREGHGPAEQVGALGSCRYLRITL
jgi:hypothetical protein